MKKQVIVLLMVKRVIVLSIRVDLANLSSFSPSSLVVLVNKFSTDKLAFVYRVDLFLECPMD